MLIIVKGLKGLRRKAIIICKIRIRHKKSYAHLTVGVISKSLMSFISHKEDNFFSFTGSTVQIILKDLGSEEENPTALP